MSETISFTALHPRVGHPASLAAAPLAPPAAAQAAEVQNALPASVRTALHAVLSAALGAAFMALPVAACTQAPTPTSRPGAHEVAGAAPLRIHDVQGAAHRSPLVGRRVQGVTGIVTAVHKSAFTMQEPDAGADARPETSEGLLVYVGAAPTIAVGDAVSVTGTVTEYRPDDRADQLTVTELSESPEVIVLARRQPLPAPVRLGRAGRVPPSSIFCDDAQGGDLDLGGAFDPDSDGLDFFESLEGMRVAVQDAVVVGPTNARNEAWVLGDGGAMARGRNARGGLTAGVAEQHPERLLLDSSLMRLPRVDVGARFPGELVGVLGYAFGNFRIAVQEFTAPVGGVSPDRDEPPARDGELLVASFNLLNFSARTEASRVTALARQIVSGLGAPDLLALQEMQDDSGPRDDGTTSAALGLARLAAAIAAEGGPAYRSVDIAPLDGQDGGQPGGNIRPALLFRTDRGLQLVERGATGARDATFVQRSSDGAPRLSRSPGLVAPLDPAFAHSRKPLAAEFLLAGRPLFVVVNHWNSKSGDQPLAGKHQPPLRGSEVQRVSEARAVRAFVDALLAVDPDADLIVLGDLNDVSGSAALAVLTAAEPGRAVLTNLADSLPPAERYGYVYEGLSQQFDHILLSPHLLRASGADGAVRAAGPPPFRSVHLNAEFHAHASDHDPCVARLLLNESR